MRCCLRTRRTGKHMIRTIVDFALNNRFLILAAAALLTVWGVVSFHNLPVEAYPDVASNYVEIVTQWPGRAAEEVEQQVTIPIENAVNGTPHLESLRSITMFGLSTQILIFDEASDNNWNRQKVAERLAEAELPSGLEPEIGADFSPVGEIYFYTLRSTNPRYDLMDLKTLDEWVVHKQFLSVPNVVEVAGIGGITREYQVRIDPDKLVSYGLSLSEVEEQLSGNNSNAGGSFVEVGLQQVNVRVVGLVRNVDDIRKTVIKTQNGTPVRISDIATVEQGTKIRLGQVGKAIHRANGKVIDDEDVVEGSLFLRKGADAEPTLKAIHAKVQEINDRILPPGVQIVSFLDRSDLIHHTTRTVLRNLTEGFILVSVVLFLFLGSARSAMIVALTIPFSLLFASICLDLRHIPANLLSLGALDFGLVVDGAVVMVENIVRHLNGREDGDKSVPDRIRAAAHEVQRPVFYAITIIITAYLPIFTLEKVEGRIFRPMAWTVAFALLGALIFSILVAPVLMSILFPKGFRGWENPVLRWITRGYRRALTWTVHHRWVMVGAAVSAVCCSLYLLYGGLIGSEFLPHLDEGSIWAFGTAAPSIGPAEGTRVMNRARVILASFPEVKQVISRVGRPDDGMDPVGFDNTEYFVDLKPKEEWRPVFRQDKDELTAAMNRQLEKFPGVFWHFTQPIADEMEEADTGLKGQLGRQDLRRGPENPRREGRGGGQGDAPDPRNRRPGNASRHRSAEPEPGGRPRRRCPLPDERRRRTGCHPDRGGWQCRQPGAPGRTALRPGGTVPSPLPRHQGSHRDHSPAFALRRARFPGATLQSQHGRRRFHALSRGELTLRRHHIRCPRPRPGKYRGGGHPQGHR